MSDSKDFLDFNKSTEKPPQSIKEELRLGGERKINIKQNEIIKETRKPAQESPRESSTSKTSFTNNEEYIESYELGMKNLGKDMDNNVDDSPVQSKHLEDNEILKKRDTTFIFLYGASSVGKTSFLISLIHHLRCDRNATFSPRNLDQNRDSHIYLRQILASFYDERILPKPTAKDLVYELDFEFEPNSPKIPAKFTFLDMQGERLEKVYLKVGNTGKLPDNIDKYFEMAGIKMCFILMIPCDAGRYYEHHDKDQYRTDVEVKSNRPGEDEKETWSNIDSNCVDFLDYIRSKDESFDNSHILFLISQWDKYIGKHKEDQFEFMKDKLPFTFARLNNRGSTIGTYSVGEVKTKRKNDGTLVEFLETINYESPKKVKDWIYNVVTGHSINESNEPWWIKMFK